MILRYMATCPRCKCRFLADRDPATAPEHVDCAMPKPPGIAVFLALLGAVVAIICICMGAVLLFGCGPIRLEAVPETTHAGSSTGGTSSFPASTATTAFTASAFASSSAAHSTARTACGIYADQPEGGPKFVDGGGLGCP